MATISLDKTVFLFPYCMWGWGEGVGLVKNPKTISDHFSVWNNFDFFIWTFFLVPNCVKGRRLVGSKYKSFFNNFLGISGNLEQFWFLTKFCSPKMGRGPKFKKNISDKFSHNFGQFGTNFIFSFLAKFLSGGWGLKKSENNCRPIFSPFWPIWNSFVFPTSRS